MMVTARFEAGNRLLVFGGCYGNLQATEALLAEARRLGLTGREMLCTGDLAAYCAQPAETVALIRAAGIATVMGNCEESLALDAADCGCGFEAGTACDLLSQQWYAFCREQLSAEAKSWMGRLPRRIEVRMVGRRLLAIHGGVSEINRFIFPSSDKTEELTTAGAEGVLGGHSGLPFAEVAGGRLWLNSGALGMPANDGTPRVWYALLEADVAGRISVRLKALDYDHGTAAWEMARAGLAEGYRACLETGFWPSLDVLPPAERAATGQALSEQSLVWERAPLSASA